MGAKYKNGQEPKLGDVVRGLTNNSGSRPMVGTIISLNPAAEVANCQVAYLEAVPIKEVHSWQTGHFIRTPKGDEFLLVPKADFADTKGLERISEPLMAQAGAALKSRAAGR